MRRDDLYVDHGASGALARRPELDRAMAALEPGDTLVVCTLDRLGRAGATRPSVAKLKPVKELSEMELTGGNASGRVVRVGSTVRKPWTPKTLQVKAYLEHLSDDGLDVPLIHGRDEQGRAVIDYVPGVLAMDQAPLEPALVRRVGMLVRQIHDASASFALDPEWPVLLPAPEPELVCHNDLATWNLIIDGDRLAFIDWDGAGPSSRLWDLAYSAIAFAHLFPATDLEASAERLRCFIDGYDADDALRAALPEALELRSRAMWNHLHIAHQRGFEPWATMFVEGHGEHWSATTHLIARYRQLWTRAVMRIQAS